MSQNLCLKIISRGGKGHFETQGLLKSGENEKIPVSQNRRRGWQRGSTNNFETQEFGAEGEGG